MFRCPTMRLTGPLARVRSPRLLTASVSPYWMIKVDDKIIAALFGAMFGFALPYFASVWERAKRAHRMVSALDHELSEVTTEIEKKLKWLGRNVEEHLKEVDQDRIVEVDGIHLYLGEREEFQVPRPYWRAKYTEIAEAISDKDFSDFYKMYRLVDDFEQKFRDMKLTFETSIGKKDVMARQCFKDLQTIDEEIKSRLTTRFSRLAKMARG